MRSPSRIPGRALEPEEGDRRPAPTKEEYEIIFGTSDAQKGWQNVCATQRNIVVTAWERLTADPLADDTTCHGMKGVLEFVTNKDGTYRRRRYELSHGARIRFCVDGTRVVLIDVNTHHPNATK